MDQGFSLFGLVPIGALGFGSLGVGFGPLDFLGWYLASREIVSRIGDMIFLSFISNLMSFSLFLLIFVTILKISKKKLPFKNTTFQL